MKQYNSLNEAIQNLFQTNILEKRYVSGGDINEAYQLILANGQSVFMKQNAKRNIDFFIQEAKGLQAIQSTHSISIPEIYGYGVDGNHSFLLMEYIEPRKKTDDFWTVFANELADMHKYNVGNTFGFAEDNYIGASRQINTSCDSWISFFKEYRLKPQIEWASRYFSNKEVEKLHVLYNHAQDLLIEPLQPSLIHGDLWAGNYMTGSDGKAWLIDPACYIGHAEADIAMTELFGGYPREFYETYKKVGLLQPGYEKRRDLYNLYHLLNHVQLFGYGYVSSVLSIVYKYV